MDLTMVSIILITHSRIKHPTLKFSGVWQAIVEGFLEATSKYSLKCEVFSLLRNYNDIKEYLEKVAEAIAKNPDIIVLPLTPEQGEYEERLIKMLESYRGIVIAINVPPNFVFQQRLKGKLKGYVGTNEKDSGRKAARELFYSGKIFDVIYVIKDKDHFGYLKRTEGVHEIAGEYGIPVCTIDIRDSKKTDIICKFMEQPAIISLGPVGTDFASSLKNKYPINPIVVAMDLDDKTAKAINSGEVLCTLIQHPREQGALSGEIAYNIITGRETSAFTNIYCGPTIVDRNNIAIFT